MNMTELIQFISEHEPRKKAVFGFDAFVDRIGCQASGLGDGPIDSMTEFGSRLVSRSNKSGAVFLEKVQEFMGGNAPNTAAALSALEAQVTCICALGYPQVQEAFAQLREKCSVVSYADPGSCLAVELGQSKLFFAHNGEMGDITWEKFKERAGREKLLSCYADADLIGLFNWGELCSTQRIWDGLLQEVLPVLPLKERMFFFDFSDISARSAEELSVLKQTLVKFRHFGRVYVSANRLEAELLCGEELTRQGVVDVFISHGKKQACAMGSGVDLVLPTRYQARPKRLTGGGDSFNAGFCYGLLCGLEEKACLMIAHAAANCLVATGIPADRAALCKELARCQELWE